MPTHSNRNNVPKPEKIAATKDTSSSLKMYLVFFVLVTSYTKNQAVKKTPIPNRTIAKCGKTAGLTGDTYLVIDSMFN